ncbi:unnamed protein product [Prunus armeniaca]
MRKGHCSSCSLPAVAHILFELQLTSSSSHLTIARRPLFEHLPARLQIGDEPPLPLLKTSCSSKHKLNGVFFKRYATSLTSIADKLLLEAQTQWSPFQALCPRHTQTGDEPYLYCKQAAPRSTNSMESFSSIMSLTYARRQQASSLLQTNCSSKHKLNGVFFEHYVPDICSQATSLTSTEDKLLLEYKLHGVFSSVMSLTYAHKRRALPPL